MFNIKRGVIMEQDLECVITPHRENIADYVLGFAEVRKQCSHRVNALEEREHVDRAYKMFMDYLSVVYDVDVHAMNSLYLEATR